MQHRIVRRVSWGIVAGLGAAAWVYAMALRDVPGDVPPPAAGALAGQGAMPEFTRHCAACHQPASLASELPDAAAAAAMIELLGRHGSAPLAADLRIVAELAAMNDAAAP